MVEANVLLEHFAVLVFFTVFVSYEASAYTPYEELELLNEALDDSYVDSQETLDRYPELDELPTEKRYARLSYNYGNRNRGGRRYYSSRYYANYYKPWMNLPDKECFRDRCRTGADCCRRYSKCDKSARVCYNCWYGHPCRTSRDCCQAYPNCNRKLSMCQA